MFPLTCAALNGSDSGGAARRGVGPSVARRHASLLLFLRAAFLYGTHVAVAPHAEAARHRQVQRVHGLRLHLAEHRLAHGLDLPIHLHLAHLRRRPHTVTACARKHPGDRGRERHTQAFTPKHWLECEIKKTIGMYRSTPAECKTKRMGKYIRGARVISVCCKI